MPELEATVKLSAGWRKCIQSKPEAEQGCNPGLRSTSLGQHSLGSVAIYLNHRILSYLHQLCLWEGIYLFRMVKICWMGSWIWILGHSLPLRICSLLSFQQWKITLQDVLGKSQISAGRGGRQRAKAAFGRGGQQVHSIIFHVWTQGMRLTEGGL